MIFLIIVLLFNFETYLFNQTYLNLNSTCQIPNKFREIDHNTNLIINASVTDSVLIRLVDNSSAWAIEYRCIVDILKPQYRIKEAKFCYKNYLNSVENCVDVSAMKFAIFNGKRFRINFKDSFGFNATSENNWIPFGAGFYYCRLRTRLESLDTNYMELRYTDYNSTRDNYIKPSPTLTVHRSGVSNLFDCGSNDLINDYDTTFQMSYPVFDWYGCIVDRNTEFNDSECSLRADKRIDFRRNVDYFQYRNGSIWVSSNFVSSHSKVGILCTTNKRKSHYSGYVIESQSGAITNETNIVTLSPLLTNVYLPEGLNPYLSYRLLAAYQISTGLIYEYEWRNAPFKVPDTYVQSAHELIFPDHIAMHHHGIYTLTVKIAKTKAEVTFRYNVIVIGTPRLKYNKYLPERVFRFPGQSIELFAEFEGYNIVHKVFVNTFELDISSRLMLDQSVQRLKTIYPYLNGTMYHITQSRNMYHTQIKFSANNLIQLRPYMGQIHLITFVAKNSVGLSKIRTVIEVLDKPTWKVPLSEFDCINHCQSNVPHIFRCEIFEDNFINRGIQVKYDWSINGQSLNEMDSLSSLGKLITVDNNKVQLNPIATDDNPIFSFLKNASLTCHVNLFAKRFTLDTEVVYESLFSSRDDLLLFGNSQAQIKITFVQFGDSIPIYIIFMIFLVIITAIIIGWIYQHEKNLLICRRCKTLCWERSRTQGRDAPRTVSCGIDTEHDGNSLV